MNLGITIKSKQHAMRQWSQYLLHYGTKLTKMAITCIACPHTIKTNWFFTKSTSVLRCSLPFTTLTAIFCWNCKQKSDINDYKNYINVHWRKYVKVLSTSKHSIPPPPSKRKRIIGEKKTRGPWWPYIAPLADTWNPFIPSITILGNWFKT